MAGQSEGAEATVNALLTTTSLTVRFGGVVAVDKVSLAIEPKRLYGLIGPNGSGKSTLLGTISRLTQSTEGAMSFRQKDYTTLPAFEVARMGIARTFQTVRLLPSLSVMDNVMLGADFRYFGSGIFRPWLIPGWSTSRERWPANSAPTRAPTYSSGRRRRKARSRVGAATSRRRTRKPAA